MRKFMTLLATIGLCAGCGAQKEIPVLAPEEFEKSARGNEKAVILDVRQPQEYEKGHLDGAALLDFLDREGFAQGIRSLDKDKEYYVYCRSGRRSHEAAEQMKREGLKVTDMEGGYLAWTDVKIKEAIGRQMSDFPASTLQDIYKSFFQNRFGPGHIISSRDGAENYLKSELEVAAADKSEYPEYEPTGHTGNFYRANLSVIAEGKVPYETYLDAFIRSANGLKPITADEWREEWDTVIRNIEEMSLNLPDYEHDKTMITEILKGESFAVHHSRQFNEAYSPHYRIIERSIFENEILPLLND